MDPFKPSAVLSVLLLVAIPLAGCTGVPVGDGGDAASDDGDDGVPEAPENCWPGTDPDNRTRNYEYSPLIGYDGTPQSDDRIHCWHTDLVSNNSVEKVYFAFFKERGVGEWEPTVYDADGNVFFHKVITAGEVFCNEEGIEAPMGEWTIVHEWRNLTGDISARLCLDRDCFNRCPSG